MVSTRIFKATDFVEPAHLARRAGQEGKMEESASHHVNDNEMRVSLAPAAAKLQFWSAGAFTGSLFKVLKHFSENWNIYHFWVIFFDFFVEAWVVRCWIKRYPEWMKTMSSTISSKSGPSSEEMESNAVQKNFQRHRFRRTCPFSPKGRPGREDGGECFAPLYEWGEIPSFMSP